jgi:acetyl-CoA carboxylase biotin carboxyl carrier protein
MIDISLVEKLLDLLSRSDAQTIEIKKHWWTTTIRISKNSGAPASGPVAYHVTAPPPISAPTAAPPSTATAPAAEAVEAASGADAGTGGTLAEIKSPMVGTFYAQPEPGADPYVNAGNRISVGQTLCIIEAMKIMNPLDAEISGVVKEVMVQDAQPVEFGQVLFRVDTNA